MHFSLAQIVAIIMPFFVAFCLILFWYKKDAETNKLQNKENLPTLISVFFWAAFGGLLLKLCIDTIYHFDTQSVILTSTWFYVLSIFLEEFIKNGSLIIGLEMAEKRFNEISDGVIYGAMAALGFLFFENIFYLLSTSTPRDFLTVLGIRYLSTFGIHLLTTSLFGLTYAKGYLGYKKHLQAYKTKFKLSTQNFSAPKPYAFFQHFKVIITTGGFCLNLIKLPTCYDLLKRIGLKIFNQEKLLLKKERFLVFPSVFITEGFLLGFYLHLFCNLLLQNETLGWLLLTIMPVFSFVVYLGFYRLDQK